MNRGHEPLGPEERALAQRLARLDGSAAPSPELDARILAMARGAPSQAAAAPPPRRRRWPVALGLAASVALALGLAWQLRPTPDGEATVLGQPGQPAQAHRTADAATAPERAARSAPPPPETAGASAVEADAAPTVAAARIAERADAADDEGGAAPPPAEAARHETPVDALADQPLDDQPPASMDSPAVREHWLQRIRELREAGDDRAARESLREFLRRHPRAEVPADLRTLLDE